MRASASERERKKEKESKRKRKRASERLSLFLSFSSLSLSLSLTFSQNSPLSPIRDRRIAQFLLPCSSGKVFVIFQSIMRSHFVIFQRRRSVTAAAELSLTCDGRRSLPGESSPVIIHTDALQSLPLFGDDSFFSDFLGDCSALLAVTFIDFNGWNW